jgi:uncharacterized protein YjlB
MLRRHLRRRPAPIKDQPMPDPEPLFLADDGTFPNSRLPVLLWRNALPADPDAVERAFHDHGWEGAWRDGIFDDHHDHATAHEVLGIARGRVTVRLGGPNGKTVDLTAGDVVLLPAGTAHRNLGQSPDLIVVGAYPPGQRPDILRGGPGERPGADRRIAGVPLPDTNPVGDEAGLPGEWRAAS